VSHNTPQTMDRKHRQDQALNLADFKIDDILSVPGDRLLAEAAEDYGHTKHLADAFDAIASPVLSRHDPAALRQGAAPAIVSPTHAAPGAGSPAASSRPSPAAWPRAALATLAGWLAMPLRRRVAFGACVALLMVAVLAPGIYPRLLSPSADRIVRDDRIAAPSKDEPTSPSPGPTPPQPQPVPNEAGARGNFQPSRVSSAVSPTPPPALPPPRAAQPTEARPAAPPPSAASRAAAPRAEAAAEAAAEAPAAAGPTQAPLQRQAAAKARPGEGFVVELAAAKSEAEARATFRTLRSRYAVLQGREPVIRRKEAGNGVSYAVQVGPFAAQEAAEQLCGQLKAAGGSCFTTRN
jgi:cell division septation protein DedD